MFLTAGAQLRTKIVSTNFLTFVVVVTLIAVSLPLSAQVTAGSIVGTVRDESGQVLPGARVTITNVETHVHQETFTGAAGRYLFPNVLVGTYRVEAQLEGFQTAVRPDVEVGLTATVEVGFTLELGQFEDAVTVTGSGEELATSAQLGTRVDSEQIMEIPQQGRDAQSLVLLSPGVSPTGAGVSGSGVNLIGGASNAFGQVGTSFSSNGSRARANSFQIDGIDDNDPARSGGRQAVIQDAVEELVLIQNNYSAEYGRTGGAIVNIVTKSGTDDFRGSAFWFHQDEGLTELSNLDERAKAADPDFREPPRDFDQVGVTFGGPLVRGKTFFFGAFQHQSIDSLSGTSRIFSPTAEGLALLHGQVDAGLASDVTLALLEENVPAAPSATRTSLINGQAIPVGPTTVNSFFGQQDDNLTFNVDHNFSGGDQLRLRFNYDDNDADVPGSLPQFGGTFAGESFLISVTELHAASSHVFNEARLGVSSSDQTLLYPFFDGLGEISIRELGLQFGPQTNGDKIDKNTTLQAVDNVSIFRGRHLFKTGIDLRHIRTEQFAVFRQRGQFIFNTFQDYANNLMLPGNGVQTFGPGLYDADTNSAYVFFQDDFQIKDNLTLNLGIRYEIQDIPGDGYFQGLNAEVDSPVFDFGEVKKDTDNFAPRLGFAWQPKKLGGPTVIRGGYGKSFDVFSEIYGILSLPPEFVQTVPVRAPTPNFLPNGITPPQLPRTPAERRALNLGGVPTDNEFPEIESWSIGFQRDLPWNLIVEARYVGTRGDNLPVRRRRNDIRVVQPLPQFDHPLTAAEADALPVPPARNIARPDPLSGGYIITGGFGQSMYNGGQLAVRRGFRDGFQFSASYTVSKFKDNMSEPLATTFATPIFPQDSDDLDADWSRSLYDRPHRFVGSFIVDLPIDKLGGPRNLTEGWRLSGVVVRQSGQVYTVLNGIDTNADLVSFNDRVNFNPDGAPGSVSLAIPVFNSAGQLVGYYDSDSDARYLQLGAFTGLAGNIPRNSERTPSTWNLDLTLAKRFFLPGDVGLELRAEVFNVFDSRQFGIPTDAGNAFGALTSSFVTVSSPNFQDLEIGAGNSRRIQLGVRLEF